jgi:uncharacterized membrane protein
MSGSVSTSVVRNLVGVLGLPEPVYVIPVSLLFLGVLGIIYLIGPEVTDATVPALGSWVAVGAVLHGVRRQSFFQEYLWFLEPLVGMPMVVLTTATLGLVAWSVSELLVEMRSAGASCDRQLAAAGGFVVVAIVGVALFDSVTTVTVRPLWPTLALFGAAIVTAVVWVAIGILLTDTAKITGRTGLTVVFAHVLDGVTTGLGVAAPDGVPFLGDRALPPLAVTYFDLARELPVEAAAVLFVAIKLALAVAVVAAFKRVVQQRPVPGRLGLGVVAGAGLGTGLHYVLLFAIAPSLPL